MNDTRNLIMAVGLSVFVMVLWQYFVVSPQQEARLAKQAQQAEDAVSAIPNLPVQAAKPLKSRDELLTAAPQQRIRINTPTLHGSLNTQGARFDDLTLAGYRVALDPNAPEVALLSPSGAENMYFVEGGWLAADGKTAAPTKNTVWQADNSLISPESPLTLRWNNGAGVEFIQHISVDERYLFTVEHEVINNSGAPVSLSPYGLINRARADKQSLYISHEGAIGLFDNVLEEITYDDLAEDGAVDFKETSGWLGMADQYWLTAFIPDKNLTFNAQAKEYNKDGLKRYQIDYVGQPVTIQAGESHSISQRMYAGAKKAQWINDYRDSLGATLFDRTVDYGWLYFLTKPMYWALTFFTDLLGHVGLAILALTVVVKLIMFPLANKSYRSMGQMRLMMPEITAMREKYKDDPMQMNQKMMAMYKEKKVNPAAGCLPIVVQIPIFFALYKMLYVTIELRHQPFFGWIQDLSAPDPTSIFNLFGLFSYDVPLWLPLIGVWPVLFGITMFIQQKLNPPPTDPTQKMILSWLPFIFVILFSSFPAGLVIYWTWSNTLSIAQQWVITNKLNSELKHQLKVLPTGKKK